MIATISPAADNYEETLSTLRYADRAKRIENHAMVNEDPNARVIRELREEVERLRTELTIAKERMQTVELKEQLEVSEKLMREVSKTWDEKLRETEQIHRERQEALTRMGISVEAGGIGVDKSRHYLVNLNQDPALNELLLYYLKVPKTLVGRSTGVDASGAEVDIKLDSVGIHEVHCAIEIIDDCIYITPFEKARTSVNGRRISQKSQLVHGDRITLGVNCIFRLNCPVSVPSQSQQTALPPGRTASSSSACDSEALQAYSYELAQEELLACDGVIDTRNCDLKQLVHSLLAAAASQQQQQQLHVHAALDHVHAGQTQPYAVDMTASMIQTEEAQREELYRMALARLKQQINRANTLVRQANCVVRELGVAVEYQVTLQVPLANLYASASTSPSARPAAALMSSSPSGSPIPCEPAILVLVHNRPKRSSPGSCAELSKMASSSSSGAGADGGAAAGVSEPVVQREQLWSVDKFENRLTEMLDQYQQCRDLSRYTSAPLASRRHLENFDDLEASEQSTPTPAAQTQTGAVTSKQEQLQPHPFSQNELSPSSRTIKEASPESNRSSRSINELLARGEPFYDSQEQHILIGVANIVLQSLFYNFEFDYEAPIISQQGEIAGKLRIQLSRVLPSRPKYSVASSNPARPPLHKDRPIREQILDSSDEEGAAYSDSGDSADDDRRLRGRVRIRDCRHRLGTDEGEEDSSTEAEADVSTDESEEASPVRRGRHSQDEANELDYFRHRELASPDCDCERMCKQHMPTDQLAANDPNCDGDDENVARVTVGKPFVCKVRIVEAKDLPPSLSNFVFCQYRFWNASTDTVVPEAVPRQQAQAQRNALSFESGGHELHVSCVTDEFLDYLAEGSLAVEVWGNRAASVTDMPAGIRADDPNSTPVASGSKERPPRAGAGAAASGKQAGSEQAAHRCKGIEERWNEVSRKLQLWVDVLELNEQGDYSPVSIQWNSADSCDAAAGGIFQLHHGQSRRIALRIAPLIGPNTPVGLRPGGLPVVLEQVLEVHAGCVLAYRRAPQNKPLDSYHEFDLNELRARWERAIDVRKQHVDRELRNIDQKVERQTGGKTPEDARREQQLIEQLLSLTEERNALLIPQPGSSIPGATANWQQPPGMEPHIPVLILNYEDAEMQQSRVSEPSISRSMSMSMSMSMSGSLSAAASAPTPPSSFVAGMHCLLPRERPDDSWAAAGEGGAGDALEIPTAETFLNLPLIQSDLMHSQNTLYALVQWDSTLHECIALNRVPQNKNDQHGDIVYLILRVVFRIRQPRVQDICLRKRIAVQILKRGPPASTNSIGSFFKKAISSVRVPGKNSEKATSSGLISELVWNIPKTFEDLEDRSILARLATRSIEQLEDSAQSTTTGNTRNSESTPRARAGTYSGVLASNNPVENGGDLHASPSIAPAAATAGAHEVGHKMNVIEHYIKCISHLEHILLMDRLRQEFAIKEQLSAKTGHRSRNDSEAVAEARGEVECRTSSPIDDASRLKKTGSVPDMFGMINGCGAELRPSASAFQFANMSASASAAPAGKTAAASTPAGASSASRLLPTHLIPAAARNTATSLLKLLQKQRAPAPSTLNKTESAGPPNAAVSQPLATRDIQEEEPPVFTRHSLIPSADDVEQSLESCSKQANLSPSQSSPSGDSLEEQQLPPATAVSQPQVSSIGRRTDPMLSNSAVTMPGNTCASEVGLMLASCSSGYGSTVSACDSATATLACNIVTGEPPFNPFAIVPFNLMCSEPQTIGTSTTSTSATECSTTPTTVIDNSVAAPPAESILFAPDSLLPDPSTLTLPNTSDSLECLDSLTQPTVELQLAAPADEECELVCHSPGRVHASVSSECLQPGTKGVPHSTSLHVITRPPARDRAPASDSTAAGPPPKGAPRRTPLTNASAAGDANRRLTGSGQRAVGPSAKHGTSVQKPISQPSRAKASAFKAK